MGGLGLAMGIGSSAAAAAKSNKAEKEQRKKNSIIDAQEAEDRALFNRQYYSDITKRTDIQNMLRTLDQNQRKADVRSEAQAAITGAAPEQKLASKEVNRRTYADSLADIASNASQIRDQYLRDYQGQRNRYYAQRLGMQDQMAAINTNAANQWSNAATNAFTSGGQMLASGLGGLYQQGKLGGAKTSSAPASPLLTTVTDEGAGGQAVSLDEWYKKPGAAGTVTQ